MVFGFTKFLILLPAIFLFNLGCSSGLYNSGNSSLGKSNYENEFVSGKGSAQLEEIGNSLYRVSCMAFYETYIFDDSSQYRLSDLNNEIVKKKSVRTTILNKPAFGTGIMIYSEDGNTAILTCAHIISFPDTLVTYFANQNGTFTDKVQSVAFKIKENIFVAGLPDGSEVNVLLKDDDLDIALLGRNFGVKFTNRFPTFNFPFGKAKDLKWGTFVYLMGYPLNYKMISHAIVSSPNYDGKGSFFVDAVVNRGFSGGVVLAANNSVLNFEMVGIVDWVPEESENVLEPTQVEKSVRYSPFVPYKGEMYVKQLEYMKYGVARIIPIELVEEFLIENKQILLKSGLKLNFF